ncbi:hypothetical protein ACF07S_05195 [Streptomyces sp. NPDC016640]|uniref:hypothetical protein n=1 Tax=Streptomyces sp. NPDC016640 TaxID=3364969 RepID=UPI0036FCB457
MTAHDEHRDPGNDGDAYDGQDDGTDALMAALLGEPPSARARRDPAFTAAHDAAAADLTVLREQLTLIGDALAAPAATGAGPGDAPASAGAGRGRQAGRLRAGRPGAGPPGTDGGSRSPGRDRRRRFGAALGALAAAAAATLVVGTGWLVTRPGGASETSADRAAAADSQGAGSRAEGGVAFGSPRYLACARLVAEGTVLAVEPVPGAAGTERVTLGASRVYKGDGDREVVFLRDTAGDPPLHPGVRVMVGLPRSGDHPDTVVAGEADIAPERAVITASLPESRTLTCG